MMGARDWLCDSPGPLASEPWAACLGLGLHRGLEGPRRARQRPREEGHLAAALGLDAPYAVSPEGLARGQAWLRLCGHPGVTWSCLRRASPSLRPAGEWQAFRAAPLCPVGQPGGHAVSTQPCAGPAGKRPRGDGGDREGTAHERDLKRPVPMSFKPMIRLLKTY